MDKQDLLDIPAYFDLIDRVEGVVSTFRNADWKGAYQRQGVAGVAAEFGRCLTMRNACEIKVSRHSAWRGIDIERLLKRHGVKVWDRGIEGKNLYFRVKARQAVWAEYMLLRAGIPVTSNLREAKNAQWAEGYAPGSEPPRGAWKRRGKVPRPRPAARRSKRGGA